MLMKQRWNLIVKCELRICAQLEHKHVRTSCYLILAFSYSTAAF